MADYIRFRLAAAKLGVSMAFFALLGGLAEKARATPLSAKPPATANFLREISIPTGGGLDRIVIQKLDSALATLEHKLAKSFDTAHKINQTFLKIKSADTQFLKIKSANTDFLKIDSANANFLKIDDANASFLKIDDANTEFLKVGSTATNSNELGGETAQAFFQGNGHVVTGAIPPLAVGDSFTPLLTIPGGIVVSVANTIGAGLLAQINNPTGAILAAVINNGEGSANGVTEQNLDPGITTDVPFAVSNDAAQLHIQLFPNSGLSEVVTIVLSAETSTSSDPSIVGQAFTGAS